MIRRALLLAWLSLLSLVAQNYQTQFSEVKMDRSKGPATWHGGVEVDAATGRLSMNFPLGPGIGARGLKFQPSLQGQWSPQWEVQPQNASTDPCQPRWTETARATHSGGFSLTPGFLKLEFLGDPESEKVSHYTPNAPMGCQDTLLREYPWKVTSYQGPNGFSGSLNDLSEPQGFVPDEAQALQIARAFGFGEGWAVGRAPWQEAVLRPATPFIRKGVAGELVIGLWHPELSPYGTAIPVVGSAHNPGSSSEPTWLHFPTTLLIVQGETAYHYAYRDGRYSPPVWHNLHIFGTTSVIGTKRFLRHIAFNIASIRNRVGDQVTFATLPGGWKAEWRTSEGPTGVGVRFENNLLTYEGVVNAPSFELAGVTKAMPTPGDDLPAVGSGPASIDGLQDHRVERLTNLATGEVITIGYKTALASSLDVSRWDFPVSVRLPGKQVSLEWGQYEYLRNRNTPMSLIPDQFLGVTAEAGIRGDRFLPVYATGVTRVTEQASNLAGDGATRVTQYTRFLATPDRRQWHRWVSTSFFAHVLLPDGSATVTRYANPEQGDTGYLESTPVRMRVLAFLKHQPVEIRHYAAGVDGLADLRILEAPYTPTAPKSIWLAQGQDLDPLEDAPTVQPREFRPVSESSAHRVEWFDRFDLRSPTNPTGDFTQGATPYPTRKRVWDRLTRTLHTSEQTDWNATEMGWKTTWTLAESISSAPASTLEYTSLAIQGATPTYPHPPQGILRLTQASFESHPERWIVAKPVYERLETRADSSPGRAAGVVLPDLQPPTTRTYDPTVPMLGRLKEVQVGTGAEAVRTRFTYRGNEGLAAAQVDQAERLGPTSNLVGPVGASYGYDPTFGLMDRITPRGAGWELRQTSDGLGRPLSQSDPNAFTNTFEWDAGGRLIAIRPPNGEIPQVMTPDPDHLGMVVTCGGQVSQYRFDAQGKLILERRKTGGAWTSYRLHGYDKGGRKLWQSIWMPGQGDETLAGYSDLPTQPDVIGVIPGHYEYQDGEEGTRIRVWIPTQNIPTPRPDGFKATLFTYDAYGREISRKDPNGITTTTAYGFEATKGLATRTVTVGAGTADAMTTAFLTDAAGRLVQVVDAKNQVTTYAYDAADRILEVRQYPSSTGTGTAANPVGTPQVRQWVYDALGQLVVLDQPESGVTYTTAYNLLGKPTRSVYGLPRGWRPATLAGEDPSAASTPGVKVLTTTYDAQGRVTSLVSADGSVNHALIYDEVGRGASKGKLTTATTGKGVSRQLTYGGLNGRLSALTRVVDGQVFTQTMGYNLDGTLKERTYPGHATPAAVGPLQTLGYDPATGLPTSTSLGGALLASLNYLEDSWALKSLSFGAAGSKGHSAFVYGPDQVRLAAMTHKASPTATTPFRTWTYGYDAAGRLHTDGEDWYAYDSLGRLTQVMARDLDPATQTTQGSALALRQSFTYDSFGNRTKLTSERVNGWAYGTTPPATPSTTALTGETRDLLSYALNASELAALAPTNQLPATLGGVATGARYDTLGNLTRLLRKVGDWSTQETLTYDALGRVTSLSDAKRATTETYLHDDEGLRIKVSDSATGKVTYHLYNEARQLIASFEKVGTGPLTWKKDIVYVGTKEVAELDSTGKTWVTFVDHLGSPRFVWNGIPPTGGKPDGVNLLEQKFLPFGESLTDPATQTKIAKGFTNHEQTEASGLIYMQARFYAPWFGRFLSPDPARDQHFEETQSWNIYSYVRNDPTMRTDPTGMVADGPFKNALNAVKNFFSYERHSSSSVTKTAEGGTLTRDKVDVERKVEFKDGQGKVSLSYQKHDLHNEKQGEVRLGPVFLEGGVTQTKGSAGAQVSAEAGLKGVKAAVGVNLGPSLGAQGGVGFRVNGFKVTVLGGEAGVQPRAGAEVKLVTRGEGVFTLAKARVFALAKVGVTLVNVQKEKQ